MTSIRKWALALCLALSFLPYSKAQDITGNLSDPWAWQNAGQIGVPITCMAPGQPGYCGPQPSIGGFGDIQGINFSYGLTDLYQTVNIGNVLPYSGTGLLVTGFTFGFTAKNGNGWDGGGLDTLSAYVNIYGANNNLRESYNYNLNYTFNWTTFTYNETFASPYKTNQLTTARFGFVGQDLNGWAGFYGPEVMNVSFSLKYAPDPCVTNPLSSPSCPGFSSALSSRITISTSTGSESITTIQPVSTVTNATTSAIAPSTVVSKSTTGTTGLSTDRSTRLQAITKSINESIAATVQATIQQSQDSNQSQFNTQDNAMASTTMGFAAGTKSSDSTDNPAAGFARPGDPAMAARGLTSIVPQEPVPELKPQPKNTQPPAELAGGVNVVAFQATVDISAYTNLVLRDVQFYAPREIYQGQQVVDNQRILKGLGSDARHQEMIEQQYRR